MAAAAGTGAVEVVTGVELTEQPPEAQPPVAQPPVEQPPVEHPPVEQPLLQVLQVGAGAQQVRAGAQQV